MILELRLGRVCLAVATAVASLALSVAADAEPAPASPASASAEPAAERIALAYSSPPECPGADTFRDEVRSRASGDWEAEPGEFARRITVTVGRRNEQYLATIEFLNPQGEDVTRSVAGLACADVVNGIALVTALAIQSRVEEAIEQSEPEPAPSAPPTTTTSAPAPAANPVRPAVPRAPAPSASRSVHLRLGAAAMASTGVGPGVAFGPELFAVLEWAGPRVGISGAALWSGSVHTGGVPASFRRLTARGDGCPAAFGSRRLALEPCAFFELGSLHGQGESDANLASTSGGGSLWLAPGLLARVLASFGPIVLAVELDGSVPLIRQRFGVVTDAHEAATFEVPPVVVAGALGLGVRL